MPNISHAGQPKNKTAVLELFLKPKLHKNLCSHALGGAGDPKRRAAATTLTLVVEGISGFSGARLCAPVEGLWVAVRTNQKFVRRTYAHMSSFPHDVPLVVHAEPAELTFFEILVFHDGTVEGSRM